MCLREYGLSYLSLRTCIGLWTAFFCLLLVATDASSLVCYITRFTEEAFAALICIIFIYEALEKLLHLGVHYPINKHNNLQKLTQYWYVQLTPSSAHMYFFSHAYFILFFEDSLILQSPCWFLFWCGGQQGMLTFSFGKYI